MTDKSEPMPSPSTSRALSEGAQTASPPASVVDQHQSTYDFSLLFVISLIVFPVGSALAYFLLPSLARLLFAQVFSRDAVRLLTDPRDTNMLICGLVYSLPVMFASAALIAAFSRRTTRSRPGPIAMSVLYSLLSGMAWYFPVMACFMCVYEFGH